MRFGLFYLLARLNISHTSSSPFTSQTSQGHLPLDVTKSRLLGSDNFNSAVLAGRIDARGHFLPLRRVAFDLAHDSLICVSVYEF